MSEQVVYVAMQGEYSDRGIVGVFSSLEVLRSKLGASVDVEEYVLDGLGEGAGTVVVMRKDGTVDNMYPSEETFTPLYQGGILSYDWPNRREEPQAREPKLVWLVITKDAETAIKVTGEKRGEILAAGLWGDYGRTAEYFEGKKRMSQ